MSTPTIEGRKPIPSAGGIREPALADSALRPRGADIPPDACPHELFAAQAARTPDAATLAFEDDTPLHAELNARTNWLAHHPRALGVGPEARVRICLERGPGRVVGVLAVLKAGAAYLPALPAASAPPFGRV